MTARPEEAPEPKFYWLKLPIWRMFLSPKSSMAVLFALGMIFLSMGTIFFRMTYKLNEYEYRYDDKCLIGSVCEITINIPKEMKGNVALLYKLNGFYQNHRNVMQSRSFAQLGGRHLLFESLSTCKPAISVDGSKDPSKLNLPCGLMALSFFNDTYEWVNTSIRFSDANISLDVDRKRLYKPLSSEYTTGNRWLAKYEDFPNETTNEHFIVWMRTAAMPVFQKIYSRCVKCKISPGEYQIRIRTSYPREMFKGKRSIVLAETGSFGSRSLFLSITNIVVGGVALIASIAFIVQTLFCPRVMGDLSHVWATSRSNDKPRSPHGTRVASMLSSS